MLQSREWQVIAVIKSGFTKNIKENLIYLLIGIAFFIVTVFFGGFYWQHCILPLFFLVIASFFGFKENYPLHTYFLASLVFIGFVSILNSMGNPHTGIYELEKFMCFVMAALVGFSLKNDIKLFKIIFYVALVTAVIGILSCCNLINVSEFIFRDGSFVRLQSFLRYANTTCCFLGCGYFAFAEIYLKERKKWLLYCGSSILVALYFTFSKAGIPIFLLVATLYLFKNKELSFIFLKQNIIAAILFIVMNYLSPMRLGAVVFIIIVFGIIITGIEKEGKKRSFHIWIGFILVCFIAGATLLVIKPDLFKTFTARTIYTKDALPLVLENPFTGCGFGSWRVIQFKVQSIQYSVTHMHNGILQFFVECGLLFGIAFLYVALRALFSSVKKGIYAYSAIILLILTHSLIDFDLSYGSILMMFGFIVGSSLSSQTTTNHKCYKLSFFKFLPKVILVGIVSVSVIYMSAEYFMRSSFEHAYLAENYEKSATKAEKLAKLCPKDAELASSQASLAQLNNDDLDTVINHLVRASELSPNDPEIFSLLIPLTMNDSNASMLCEKYINMSPKLEKTYALLKEYLSDCRKKDMISEKTFLSTYAMVEDRRVSEKVIDRNSLLEKITKK